MNLAFKFNNNDGKHSPDRSPLLGASISHINPWSQPFPVYNLIQFRTDILQFLTGVFAPLHQLLHSDQLLLRKRCDLQNNNGEKSGGEFAQHAVHRRNNVFAGNMFLKLKRYGKGWTQGYSADGGSG